MITYQSTRGSSKKLSFEDVILSGVADDKGLYLPTSTTIENLSYLTQEDLNYEDFVKLSLLHLIIIQRNMLKIYQFILVLKALQPQH